MYRQLGERLETASPSRRRPDPQRSTKVAPMKFDMGAQTLSTLTQQTGTSNQDLGQLVRKLVNDVAPLEGKFNGQGRAKFDEFKHRADEVANELNGALAAILQGQGDMNTAFQTGDQESADNASQTQGQADFSAADFKSRR
ncbi:MAG: WXG100 family type VII secretion target [Chloroflexota bacterium]